MYFKSPKTFNFHVGSMDNYRMVINKKVVSPPSLCHNDSKMNLWLFIAFQFWFPLHYIV